MLSIYEKASNVILKHKYLLIIQYLPLKICNIEQ